MCTLCFNLVCGVCDAAFKMSGTRSMWSAGKRDPVGRKNRPVQKLFISFLSFWTDVGYANDDFACP